MKNYTPEEKARSLAILQEAGILPQNSWATENILRPAARTQKWIAEETAGFADLANLPYNTLARTTGLPTLDSQSHKAGNYMDEFSGSLTVPRNNKERVVDSAGKGVAGAALMTLAALASRNPALAPLVINSWRGVVGSAAGGAGAELAHQAFPDSPLAPILGAVAGGGTSELAHSAGNVIKHPVDSAQSLMQWLFKVNPEKVATNKEVGIPATIADVSDRKGVARAQNAFKEQGWIGQSITDALDKAQESIGGWFKKSGMDNDIPPESAGALGQKGLKGWQTRGMGLSGRMVSGLQKHSPENVSIDAVDLENIVNKTIAKQRQLTSTKQVKYTPQKEMGYSADDVERLREWERGPKTRQVPDKFGGFVTEDIPKPELKPIEKTGYRSASDGTDMPFEKSVFGKISQRLYQVIEANKKGDALLMQGTPKAKAYISDLISIREEITNAITTFGTIGTPHQGALKNLRGAIQGTLGKYYESLGPEAAKDWRRFNKFYTDFNKKNERIVSKIADNKDAIDTFTAVIRNKKIDKRRAQAVLSSLSLEERQVFSNSLMSELGATAEHEFSAATLAKNWKRARPEVQDIVLNSYSPETQKQYRKVLDSMARIEQTEKAGSYSVPGRLAAGVGAGAIISSAAVSGGIGGFATATMGTAALTAAMKVPASLFSNEKFINWLAKTESIKDTKAMAQHVSKLANIAKTVPMVGLQIEDYIGDIKRERSRAILREAGIDEQTGQPFANTNTEFPD